MRLINSSLCRQSHASENRPARQASTSHFFVQRFECVTTNVSAATWDPAVGVRFAEAPHLCPPISARRTAKRVSHFEYVMQSPVSFSRPLWHVQCSTDREQSLLFIDMWVDMHVLQLRLEHGVPIDGRRVLIESIRHVRSLFASYDGLDEQDNFVACSLWPQLRHEPHLTFQSLNDARYLFDSNDVTGSDVVVSESLRTSLHDGQLRTFRKMVTLEKGVPFVSRPAGVVRMSTHGSTVFVGAHDRFIDAKVEPSTLRGGYLCNAMGTGKTLCVIATCEYIRQRDYCLQRPKGTIVICPSQVVQHWVSELHKHVDRDVTVKVIATKRDIQQSTFAEIASADYVIVSFNFFSNSHFRDFMEHYSPASAFSERCHTYTQELERVHPPALGAQGNPFLLFFEWPRAVVDEFHELDLHANGHALQAVLSLKARVRWMLSGSPFMNAVGAVKNVRQFMCPDQEHDYRAIAHIFASHIICEKDCRPKELPQLVETVVWMDMTSTERRIYEGLASQGRQQQLRACASVGNTSIVQNAPVAVNDVDEISDVVRRHMLSELHDVSERLSILTRRMQSVQSENVDQSSRLSQWFRECCNEQERLTARQSEINGSLKYLEESLPSVADASCPICFAPFDDGVVAVVKNCGHTFCQVCLEEALSMAARCPSCRRPASMSSRSVVTLCRSPPTYDEEMCAKYGVKVATLLSILRQHSSRKIIIFSQWDEFIKDIGSIVKLHTRVLFCRGSVKQKQCSIDRFRTSDDHNVLMLSMLNSGSGCDLSVANMIIMMDIVDGPREYVLDVERQAISRCYRCGQTCDVTVLRLLMRNTVEADVYTHAYQGVDCSTLLSYAET